MHSYQPSNGEEFEEHVKWLYQYAKKCQQVTVESILTTMTIATLTSLKNAVTNDDKKRCLKALSYFFLNGKLNPSVFSSSNLSLLIKNLRAGIAEKKVFLLAIIPSMALY